MFKKFLTLFNVRPEEARPVLLLLINGFFLGSFLATFLVGAEVLFLNRMYQHLELAFLVSGALGVVTTSLFSFAQNRISFGKLSLLNQLLVALFTGSVYYGYNYLDPAYQDFFIFGIFAMIGPITAVLLLSFWGLFGRLFDLRQSKRIIGWIDSGQLVASIITFFSIPFLSAFIGETDNIFIISFISIILSMIFLVILLSTNKLEHGSDGESSKEVRKQTSLSNLLKNKYVRVLSGFLVFSMMAFIILQFSFQDTVSKQYPNEEDLLNFLSFYEGFILIFMLFLQTFVNDTILSKHGIKVALLIQPVILLVFVGLTIAVGHYYGYLPEGTNFIFFFFGVALSRLFSKSLREALENPTFKLYFMPLDNRVRFNIQTKLEGILNEGARMITGLLIVGLSFLPFFQPIHFLYLLLFILIAYFVLVDRLYNEYRDRVRLKLKDRGMVLSESTDLQLIDFLNQTLNDRSPEKVVFSVKLLEKMNPGFLNNAVNHIMEHEKEHVREYAQIRLNEIKGLSVSDKYIVTFNPAMESYKGRKMVSDQELEELLSYGEISQRRILKLSRSTDPSDRLYVNELILNSITDENLSLFIELLNDEDYNVRISAIKASAIKYNPEVIMAVVNNLASPEYSNQASDTLVIIGANALNTLEAAFYKSGQSTAVMIKIIQIMGRIGGNKARVFLWGKISFPDKVLVSQVLLALGACGFKAGISQITHIKYAIESDISDIAWNMAAISELPERFFGKVIKDALAEENEHDIEHIYMLLGMLYDYQSIQLVKENIESGTAEGVSFAIELLDVFLSDDLKQKVIPVLDDISESEKVKRLEMFYPRGRLPGNLVMKFLINRDYNQTNRWTKACTIYQIGLVKIKEFNMDLIANLFNPDELVREVSAWSLYSLDKALYLENTTRLSNDVKSRLDDVILKNRHRLMKINKIRFLKNLDMFRGTRGVVIADLVDASSMRETQKGDRIYISDSNNLYFYIIYQGKIAVNVKGERQLRYVPGDLLGEVITFGDSFAHSYLEAEEDSILLQFHKDTFYDFLADHVKLAFKVVEHVK
ncbi:MAG: cyclic nucleotide-binding domain-containing protein [Cyclobacteriaceae bacterium]|nr:cyclic nucleotide-binding domain-containing protein [Cyclobacteriaceae bacterium]